MIPLTDKENKLYEIQKFCQIYQKVFSTEKNNKNIFKLYHKFRDHSHYNGEFRKAAHSICKLRYKTSKEIPIISHNGFTYDYYLVINQLAKEVDGQLECLGENTEKHITFSVPIKINLTILKQLPKN